MKVQKHLLNDIKPLLLKEGVNAILDAMEELKFSQLPVVNDEQKYLGVISEDDLLEVENESDTLSQHERLIAPFHVLESSHLFEAIAVISKGNLSLLPVIDAERNYKGYLSSAELLQDIGAEPGFSEPGGVLVLKIEKRDYHLTQIAQIVESEDARIMGLYVASAQEKDTICLCLKLNQMDLTRIIKSFDRFNYEVLEAYHTSLFEDDASDRYDAFMNYLNI